MEGMPGTGTEFGEILQQLGYTQDPTQGKAKRRLNTLGHTTPAKLPA